MTCPQSHGSEVTLKPGLSLLAQQVFFPQNPSQKVMAKDLDPDSPLKECKAKHPSDSVLNPSDKLMLNLIIPTSGTGVCKTGH